MSAIKSYLYAHFSGAINGGAQLQIKNGPGVLHAVVLNTVGATPAVVAFGDGVVGSVSVITGINAVANSTACPNDAIFDIRFNVGLVVQGNGAGQDITVVYE